MRVLHTSDWHVGRTVRGRSRDDEHRAVLAEIAGIIRDERIDLVLIAGDIFDHAAPTATAEQIVYEALLAFREAGAKVALIAGNHDHPDRLEAVAPFLELASIRSAARLRPGTEGGCIDVETGGGETARIAMLPWLRRSQIHNLEDLMQTELGKLQGIYSASWKHALRELSATFGARTVNLVLAHVVFTGAVEGGGERASETVEDYWVPPDNLDVGAQYFALGHIHKPQSLRLMYPVWYCGSPLQLDFGEEKDAKAVLVFEARAGLPVGAVQQFELKAGRRMVTLRGTLAQLRSRAEDGSLGDAYLRVYVQEPPRAGLADEVRAMLPNAVEVKVDWLGADDGVPAARQGMQPRDLLRAYFDQANVHDDKALDLFDELLEEENAAAAH
jgi:exonuclease SbcD